MLGVKTLLVLAFATYAVASKLQKTSLSQAEYDLEEAESLFEEFVKVYERQYINEHEKKARFELFKEHLKTCNELNKQSLSPTFGINKFADLSPEEGKMLNGFNPEMSDGGDDCQRVFTEDFNPTGNAPDAFDWRDKNGVTPVKNQGDCGSCWAFSAVGLIESQNAIKSGGQFIDLSEQQLVDCDTNDSGCYGGLPSQALTYYMQAGGAEDEGSYPYQEIKHSCSFNQAQIKIRVTGCKVYNNMPEDQMKELLYSYGPLSIAIPHDSLLKYNKGILTACIGKIDHAVLLVGYGSENGLDFWIVKNSWGTDFGESGYFRMQRGVGLCQIVNPYMTSATI